VHGGPLNVDWWLVAGYVREMDGGSQNQSGEHGGFKYGAKASNPSGKIGVG
jgi:hypothetical protein